MIRTWRQACAAAVFLSAAPRLAGFQSPDAASPPNLTVRSHTAIASTASVPKPLVRVDSALVQIPVHVTNGLGTNVTGLDRDRFRILEDNSEQTIATFGTEDAPVSIGLVFYTSGSMRPKMGKAAE